MKKEIFPTFEENLYGFNQRLKRYDATIRPTEKGYKFISREKDFLLGVSKKSRGFPKEDFQKIVETLAGEPPANKYKETSEEISNYLLKEEKAETEKSGLERQVIKGALIFLSVTLVTLILSQTKLLTGYAISNISNTTSGTGIFICVAGILGLLYYRNKIK
jgi:hypothetical protein